MFTNSAVLTIICNHYAIVYVGNMDIMESFIAITMVTGFTSLMC